MEEERIYKGGDIPSQENDVKKKRAWFKYQRVSTGPWEKKDEAHEYLCKNDPLCDFAVKVKHTVLLKTYAQKKKKKIQHSIQSSIIPGRSALC